MRLRMQGKSAARVRRQNCHHGSQRHAYELSRAILGFHHFARGRVMVVNHGHLICRAQVQIPEHVARGKAGGQKFLGIVTGRIAAKARGAGTFNQRLARGDDRVVAAVTPVTLRALAIIAGPIHADLIAMAVQALASNFFVGFIAFFFDFAAGAGPSAAFTCSMV